MVPGIGEWHHFAVTFDGVSGQSAIYYDGEKVDVSFTTPAGVGTADTDGFHIGTYRGGSGRFFEGLIDEVGIWNRVLRADEIVYLAEGNAIPEPDQEVAPVVIDESPKDQIATVGGTVIFEVVASGQGALTYQWTSNGEAIDGATSSTFGLWNIQPSDAGVYGVIVTNAAGSVTSEPGILKVEEAPSSPRDSVAGGLVASWSFDDSLESGIAGFDGEAINGATLTDDARVGSGAISLKQAQGQYVDIDRQVLINGALAYSSAGWFKVTGGEGRRFLWETSPSNWAVSTEVTPAGNVKAFTKLADGSSHSADSGMVPGIGEWHHFTVTFDGVSGQSAIYYDGQKVDVSFATPAGVGTADTSGFHIGAYRGGSGRFFEGLIDEVGIWNRVLSEDEVAYLAEGNPILTPPASLNITRVQISEGNIQIEWEGGDSPFQVQSRTSLSEGFWENVGDPINETNYEEAIDAAMKFFQVVQP
jgi:predicted heme/steroid binding protein